MWREGAVAHQVESLCDRSINRQIAPAWRTELRFCQQGVHSFDPTMTIKSIQFRFLFALILVTSSVLGSFGYWNHHSSEAEQRRNASTQIEKLGLRVLVVDDNAAAAEAVAELPNEIGCASQQVASGMDGLQTVRAMRALPVKTPHCVLPTASAAWRRARTASPSSRSTPMRCGKPCAPG